VAAVGPIVKATTAATVTAVANVYTLCMKNEVHN
jgi:hypothetical protein